MAADPGAEIILIHDGARPLVTEAVIRAAAEGAKEYGAALPAVPVTDTIKVSGDGFVESTPDRSTLFAAQTPQAFQAELIKAALTDAVEKGLELTDDCAAVERLGMRVRLVTGDGENRKITTPPDLAMAETLLRQRLDKTEQGA
jgi:2-C-methyl-D-erythritol 4-phosphate cytidylyltransferase